MSRIHTFLIAFILAAMTVGCRSTAAPPENATETVTEPTKDTTADMSPSEADPPEPITVVDALGRELNFDAPPERIAIAGRATALIAHSVYMFPGAIDRIVAVEDRVQRDISFYSLVDPAFEDKLLLERNAGPEQIIPSNPDVVLMKSYLAESLGEPIEQLGIPVVYFDLETPEQFEHGIAVLGKLLGNSYRSQEIIDYYSSRSEQIEALITSLPEDDHPGVLLMQYSDRGGEIAFNVPSVDWLQTSLIKEAGGVPVWLDAAQSGGWTIVGFEQIAAWDPQIIIVIYYPGDPVAIVETLKTDPNWQALSATQNDQIYGFAGDFLSWDQPDPRWLLGLTWLATALHPEETAAIDLKAEVSMFYSELYNLDMETIENEVFPRLVPLFE